MDWRLAGADDSAYCVPPDGHAAEVADRIPTGIFGYAFACTRVSDGDDACNCAIDGLANGYELELEPYGDDGQQRDLITFTVESDGTFEVALEPGVSYGFSNFSARSSDGEFLDRITLEEGEVRLLRATYTVSC